MEMNIKYNNNNKKKMWTVIEEKSGDLLLIKVWSGEITIAIHWTEKMNMKRRKNFYIWRMWYKK
jgi:hypothetical protein